MLLSQFRQTYNELTECLSGSICPVIHAYHHDYSQNAADSTTSSNRTRKLQTAYAAAAARLRSAVAVFKALKDTSAVSDIQSLFDASRVSQICQFVRTVFQCRSLYIELKFEKALQSTSAVSDCCETYIYFVRLSDPTFEFEPTPS